MKSFVIAVKVAINDKFTKPLGVITGNVKKSSLIMQNAYAKANATLSSGLGRARDLSVVGQTVLGVSNTLAKGLMNVVDAGKEYELQLSKLRAATDASTPVIGKMGLQARMIGPAFGYSAAEAVGGLTELGKAGMSAAQSSEALPGLLALSRAGYMEVADAATFGADAMSAFGLQAKDFGRVADIMVGAADASTIGVADLAETFKYTSAVAKLVGASVEETAGITALLGSKGIKGSMAGTAMKQMFVQLANPKNAKILQEFGVETMDKKGDMRDMPLILEDIAKRMEGMKKKWGSGQKLAFMNALFDVRAAPAALNLIDIGSKGIADMIKKVNTLGVARKKAEIIMNNVTGNQLKFNQAVENMKIAVFEQIAPSLNRLLKYLTGIAAKVQVWAEKNPALVKSIVGLVVAATVITAVVGPLLILITTLGVMHGAFAAGRIIIAGWGATLMATPVGWIIAAVALIIGAVVLLVKYWKPISGFFKMIWSKIVGAFKNAWKVINSLLSKRWGIALMMIFYPWITMPLLIMKHWGPIKKFFLETWTKIKGGFNILVAVIKTAFARGELSKVFGPIMAFPDLIIKNWDKVTRFFKDLSKTMSSVTAGMPGPGLGRAGANFKLGSGFGESKFGKWLNGDPFASPKATGNARPTSSGKSSAGTTGKVEVHFSNTPPGTTINTSKAGKDVSVSRGKGNVMAR